MAMQLARMSVPPSVAALPFLLARRQSGDFGWELSSALAAASAAERAHDGGRRNTRFRVAWLLCELGYQLRRRGLDRDQELPLSRAALADALGISLCRVKRTMALLCLSQVARCDSSSIKILDWRRLSSLACYDPRRLELRVDVELEPQLAWGEDERGNLVTASGDPACFV